MKEHEEKSSSQLRPLSELGPQGEQAVLSGRLVDSTGVDVTQRLHVGFMQVSYVGVITQ